MVVTGKIASSDGMPMTTNNIEVWRGEGERERERGLIINNMQKKRKEGEMVVTRKFVSADDTSMGCV